MAVSAEIARALYKGLFGPRKVGFWFSEDEPWFPWPRAHATPRPCDTQALADLLQVEGHLWAHPQEGQLEHDRGYSLCRCCGGFNGSGTVVAGGWSWPEGLAHYLKDHGVRVPRGFRRWLAQEAGRIRTTAPDVVPRVLEPVQPFRDGRRPLAPSWQDRGVAWVRRLNPWDQP